jgi:O-antigen/teichoic acid export membrane protein
MKRPTLVKTTRTSASVRSRGLSTDVLWMVAGNALYVGCQWGVLVATVKCGTPEMVGRLSLGFAICAPVFLFCQLRLRAASATDAKSEYESPEYVTLRLLCTLLALVAVVLVCIPGRFTLETTLTILAVAVAKAIESGSDLFYGFMQNAEQNRPIAISMILRGVMSLAGFVTVLVTSHNLLWALTAFCAGWGLVLILVDFPLAARLVRHTEGCGLHVRWRWGRLAKLAKLSLPLGISAMLMSLAVNMPRYFVQQFAGEAELGLFSALAYLTIASGMIVNSLAEVTVPRFARLFHTERFAEAKRLLLLSMLVTVLTGAVSVLVAAFFSHALLTVLYRAQYAASGDLLSWLMVAAAVANVASVFSYVLVAARKFNLHLLCLIVLATGSAVASWMMVPRWHARGAAFASIAGFALQAAVAGWGVHCFLKSTRDRQSTGRLFAWPPARRVTTSA